MAAPRRAHPHALQRGQITRERFAEHANNDCASCHKIIDPLGFAFDSYDALGRFRTTDGGAPVNTTGTITLPSGGGLRG